jgi:hypothetical protein
LFFGGKATFLWRKIGGKLVNKIEITGNSLNLYKIPQNIEHTVVNNNQSDIYIIAISDTENRGTVKSAKLI